MALASELIKLSFNGNGSTTVFAISFIFYADTDIRAILVDAAGAETPQTLGADFTLSGGAGAVGTLTMIVAPPSGERLIIKSNRSTTQETELPLGGSLPSTAIELRMDILTRLIQQTEETLSRTLISKESSLVVDLALPDPVPNFFLKWNGAGTALTSAASSIAASSLTDANGDTSVEVEQGADDDTIRFNALGIEVATMVSTAFALTVALTTTSTVDGRNLATDGAKLDLIEDLADVTDAGNVGALATLDSDYTNNSLRYKNNSGTMANVQLIANRFLGRAGGEIQALSAASALSILGVEAGSTADQTGAEIKSLYEGEVSAFTDAQFTKLGNIEPLADVTDNANVNLAGATMNADSSLVGNSYFIDEDAMGSNDATKVPSQQSVKAYVDTEIALALAGEMTYKGAYNASSNTPDLDTSPSGVQIGDMYTVSVAGTFFTTAVEAGDVIIAEITNAAVEADWTIANRNVDAASPTVPGIVELATITEVNTGTDNTRAITPDSLEGSALQIKVNAIETAATADQTNTEIRDAVEAATNSNTFNDTDHSKLNAIEALAEVTSTAKVTSAGALMDSEVDLDIKTLILPADTTISAFGRTLVDDAAAVNARATLGLVIGTNVLPEIALVTTADAEAGTATAEKTWSALRVREAVEAAPTFIAVQVVSNATDTATGTGQALIHVPFARKLTAVHAEVATAGTTGTLTVDINRNGTSMLSTKLTIDSAETGSDQATAAVIDAAQDDTAINDVITIDIDGVHTTPAKGLVVTMTFENS